MTKTDSARSIPLLSLLTTRQRRTLNAELVETRYAKGQYIFREGDPADYFHILKEGHVKCVKSSAQGRACTLKVLTPGDLFCCEAAVFDGACHPGSAETMGNVTVLRLRKQTYFKLLRKNPDAALAVIQYLGQRLNEAQERSKELAFDRAEQRLAGLLVQLAARMGVRTPDGIRLNVRLTRQDLADMVGITTETAIRVMGRFKRAKLVTGTAGTLLIRDMDGLNRLTAV
jgi:CRP/FNR family transcriptional regulator